MSRCATDACAAAVVGRGAPEHPHRTIAWIIRGDESYGVRQGTLSLLQGLRELGWCTPVVSLRRGDTASASERLGCGVYYVEQNLASRPDGGIWRKVLHFAVHQRQTRKVSTSIAAVLRPMHPDGIHIPWPDLVTVAGQVAASLGVPCLWHLPTVIRDSKLFGAPVVALFYQWQCRQYRILPLANSRATAATLGGLWVKPKVLHLGVDAHRFDPDRVSPVRRGDLGIPQDALVFGMFGRVLPEKGQDRVLKAIASVQTTGPELHLLIVGDPTHGPYAEHLRQIAAEHNMSGRLHLLGHVEDTERYYAAVDVAVNAFLGVEGFGLSVVEAMMMGKPVLVHALGGPAETVIDGVTGWHVPEPTVPAFVQGLRRALATREEWPQMGAQARQDALRNFSIDAFTTRYIAVVERTLADRADRR